MDLQAPIFTGGGSPVGADRARGGVPTRSGLGKVLLDEQGVIVDPDDERTRCDLQILAGREVEHVNEEVPVHGEDVGNLVPIG
jgi:hypothetical protein